MQESVNDDTSKFLIECGSKLLGIRLDGIEADVYVATQSVVFAIVKADVVGIVVVSDEPTVDVEHRFVVHEDVVDVAHYLIVCGSCAFHPSRDLCLDDVRHLYVYGVVGNHSV